MRLAHQLLQHAAEPGSLRLWLGAESAAALASLSLRVDGQALAPLVVQADDVLPAPAVPPVARHYLASGVGDPVRVEVLRDQQVVETRWLRPLRPLSRNGRFRILLASCYAREKADLGAIEAALNRARKHGGGDFDLCLLMGDQVYLDLPWYKPWPKQPQKLLESFHDGYRDAWLDSDGLALLMRAAPVITLADDHELWNNAPDPQIQLKTTRTKEGRDRVRKAAACAYASFRSQPVQSPPGFSEISVLALGLIHVIAADVRWLREAQAGSEGLGESARLSRKPGTFAALQRCVEAAQQAGALPLLVIGQGMFREATGRWWQDFEQADFADFRQLCRAAEGAGGRMLVLSGDVHFGRVAWAREQWAEDPAAGVYEAFVSPLALIGGSSKPELKDWGPFPKLTQKSFQTPQALAAFSRTGHQAGGSPVGAATMSGDHFALLSLDASGAAVDAEITYFDILGRGLQDRTVPLFTRRV